MNRANQTGIEEGRDLTTLARSFRPTMYREEQVNALVKALGVGRSALLDPAKSHFVSVLQ